MHKIRDYVLLCQDVLRHANVQQRHQNQMFYHSQVTMSLNRLLDYSSDRNNFHTIVQSIIHGK